MPQLMDLSDIRALILIRHWQGISTGKGYLYCNRRPVFSVYPLRYVRAAHRNAITSQAAKKVRASEDDLFEIFDRLEAFFQRLEIYTEMALDRRMVDTVAKIMAETLNILAIATNEISQGRISEPYAVEMRCS